MAKCQLESNNFVPCPAMKTALNGNTWNSKAKGFYVRQVINFKTLEERVSGVVFRFGKEKDCIYLNCCPFCTTMLDTQHHPKKALVGGDRT